MIFTDVGKKRTKITVHQHIPHPPIMHPTITILLNHPEYMETQTVGQELIYSEVPSTNPTAKYRQNTKKVNAQIYTTSLSQHFYSPGRPMGENIHNSRRISS